jgi:hypothetical protein
VNEANSRFSTLFSVEIQVSADHDPFFYKSTRFWNKTAEQINLKLANDAVL